MSEQFSGKVQILNNTDEVTITLDGQYGRISLVTPDGEKIISLRGGIAEFGGGGGYGAVRVKNHNGDETVLLKGIGSAVLGGNGAWGVVATKNRAGNEVARLAGGTLRVGGNGTDGVVRVRNQSGQDTISLRGDNAYLLLGLNGIRGFLELNNSTRKRTVRLDGQKGMITLGSGGVNGSLYLRNKDGKIRVIIAAFDGALELGGNGRRGRIRVKSEDGKDRIDLNGSGSITLGGHGRDGYLTVRNREGKQRVHLNGTYGDIILDNADCAEEFEMADAERVEPGTVAILDDQGKLRRSTKAYDKRVVGIVSGAGNCRPGIILGRKQSQNMRVPVTLMGKVFCNVDAQYSPIDVGDLLTTSHTPGHAMKAENPYEAFGAVIGKAIQPLESGRDLIPILASLQ